MGSREKALRDGAAESFPPDGGAYFCDFIANATLERAQLLDGLEEALDGWEYASSYKGEYLAKKHGDAEDIARLRELLKEADQ